MAAVAADAVGDETLLAQLRPSGAAMAAHSAAFVVMAHHALADAGLAFADARGDGNDNAAGLVPGDDRSLGRAADGKPATLGGAIGMKIAAAHARRLHGKRNLAGTGCRVRKVLERKLALAEEHHALHVRLSRQIVAAERMPACFSRASIAQSPMCEKLAGTARASSTTWRTTLVEEVG